jgi:S1/P1 Nuclease
VKPFVIALAAWAALAPAAQAWNNKGHMVVARIAWKELSPAERTKIVEILGPHPHAAEFLKGDRPGNIPEDEWMFLRAATWSDWIRSGPHERRQFHRATWHYTNIPFVEPGSTVTPAPPADVNVVKQIGVAKLQAKSGTNTTDRAVYTCWLFHLVGDVHQPMHCITLFGDDFPTGDRGGNLARLRVHGSVIQLHSFWDGLLGKSATLSTINATLAKIDSTLATTTNTVATDLATNTTAESWAKESFDLGREFAYLNGTLIPASSEDDHSNDNFIPEAPEGYADKAGEVARLQVYKAGKRLAAMLKEIAAAN